MFTNLVPMLVPKLLAINETNKFYQLKLYLLITPKFCNWHAYLSIYNAKPILLKKISYSIKNVFQNLRCESSVYTFIKSGTKPAGYKPAQWKFEPVSAVLCTEHADSVLCGHNSKDYNIT